MHGGKSTGPRTPEGLARLAAARTTHGDYSAAERAGRCHVRALVVRSRLLAKAYVHAAWLPPALQARLADGPVELRAPKHPSQVAFEAGCVKAPCTVAPGTVAPGTEGRGTEGRGTIGRGTTGRDARGRFAARTRPSPRGWAAERMAARVEAAALAPWKLGIAWARARQLAARAARRATPGRKALHRGHGGGTPGLGSAGNGAIEAVGKRATDGIAGARCPEAPSASALLLSPRPSPADASARREALHRDTVRAGEGAFRRSLLGGTVSQAGALQAERAGGWAVLAAAAAARDAGQDWLPAATAARDRACAATDRLRAAFMLRATISRGEAIWWELTQAQA